MAGIHTVIGRPSIYSPEIATQICERVSNGETLRGICRDDHMPSRQTIADWVMQPPRGAESFPGRFARAKELGCDSLVEESLEIARDGSRDTIETEHGTKTDWEVVGRSKLICEQIRWIASKVYRRQYGEDGLFAGLAASGAKVSVTIETVGAPAVEAPEPPTFTVDSE